MDVGCGKSSGVGMNDGAVVDTDVGCGVGCGVRTEVRITFGARVGAGIGAIVSVRIGTLVGVGKRLSRGRWDPHAPTLLPLTLP